MQVLELVKRLALVWRAKKTWHMPRQAKTLIYDRNGSDVLLQYINKENVEILDVRGESINVYLLLKCVFSLKLRMRHYAAEYFSVVKPAVAITFIDNNPNFYKLKDAHPELVTVSVQNGIRGESPDIFGYFRRNAVTGRHQVDYILTFCAAVGEKYLQFLDGQSVPIGSVQNNFCEPVEGFVPGTLVFISQFSAPKSGSDSTMYFEGKRPISWGDFFYADKKVLMFLARYCERKCLSLQVYARDRDPSGAECTFYKALLGNTNWQLIPKGDRCESYKVIDRAEFVVFIDSTLGYESLARGKKTASFFVKGGLLNDMTRTFGWPASLPDNGPFWTNRADESEFERVLDYLTSVSDADWEKTRQQFVPNLMEFDPGNTRLIALLQKLDVQLNDRYVSHVQR